MSFIKLIINKSYYEDFLLSKEEIDDVNNAVINGYRNFIRKSCYELKKSEADRESYQEYNEEDVLCTQVPLKPITKLIKNGVIDNQFFEHAILGQIVKAVFGGWLCSSYKLFRASVRLSEMDYLEDFWANMRDPRHGQAFRNRLQEIGNIRPFILVKNLKGFAKFRDEISLIKIWRKDYGLVFELIRLRENCESSHPIIKDAINENKNLLESRKNFMMLTNY